MALNPLSNETRRLEELYLYDILDSEEEKPFNDLIGLAALICDCPISTITFVDKDRQWFKARKNMPDSETPREISFCAQAILHEDVLVVEDAFLHPQFSHYSNVTGGIQIRFYAGSPVLSAGGENIGTICVIDSKPKALSAAQKDALKKLSSQVSQLLELHLLNKRLQKRSEKLFKGIESYKEFFDNAPLPQWITSTTDYGFLAVNKAAQKVYGYREEEFLQLTLMNVVPLKKAEIDSLTEELHYTKKANFISSQRKKDGSEVVVDVTLSHIVYEGKTVLIATMIDLSESLQLQQNLLEEKKQVAAKVEEAALHAQSQEREYLGKELHDNINQMLAGTKLYLDVAYNNDDMRLDLIRQSKEHLIAVMNEIRTLSKKLVASSPKGLDLVEAIEELLAPYYLAAAFQLQFTHNGNLNTLPADMKIGLLRIVQEGIHNTVKYAEATDVRIDITVDKEVHLTILDDGKGFDTTTQREGIGIRNIHERTTKLKGTVNIWSSVGEGCTIKVLIPLCEL